MNGPVEVDGCQAWPLPLDGTCASVARRLLRETATAIGLPEDVIDDGVTMASELAANTLHAQGNVEFDGSRQRPVTGAPELWLYVRGLGMHRELVCKVFDSEREWTADPAWTPGAIAVPPHRPPTPEPHLADPDAIGGRGLQVVAGLSAGRWGLHLTRARLGRWKVQGKAVWFALPIPLWCLPNSARARDTGSLRAVSSRRSGRELAAKLVDRGVGNRLVCCEEVAADMLVISVRQGLTVWCRDGCALWQTPSCDYVQLSLADLIEITERVVQTYEELTIAGSRGA